MEAVAHAAAVEPLVGEHPPQIRENSVVLLIVEVLGRGRGVVIAELDGDPIGQEPLDIGRELVRRIVLIEHAVDARAAGNAPDDLVRALLDVFDEVAGDIHAGDLVLVLLGKGNHLLGGVPLLHREGRVDIDLVRRRDGVQHLLQGIEVGQRLAAGEDEVARGRDFVHRADAAQDRLQAEARAVLILLLVDAEGTMVVAVIGNKDRDGSAARPGLIRIAHVNQPAFQ